MITFPNAKINIGLNVIQRRADGYHNLETVFYPINIKDALEILPADKLSFQSSGIDIPGRMEDNLCIKGYHLIKRDYDLPPVKIHLHKNIPIGAGLGGGSADAAFFIKLLNQTFALDLTIEQMTDYARQLGADCAFFIESKPVYAFGKGDEFLALNLDLSRHKIVLVMPEAHVSTGEAYRGVKAAPVQGVLREQILEPISEWRHNIKNDFENSVFRNHPVIRGVKAALYEAGALYASMSGSGASVFGIFNETPDLLVLEKTNRVFYNV
ncbi:4-(cytidine 5'-diphospho)-2-C-methyl-D-erythritol kinase [Mucilaginibacter gynuensis]|uniref:4-diphosphocytidyl-2-C-methyl-D-erythritol kinase n=1 Tax=Mucilaginibacter gynuensis TaxID=1302236 RepID=A0ABP8HJU9_9SPHI